MLRMWPIKNRGVDLVTCIVIHLLWVLVVSSIEVEVDYIVHDQQGDTMPEEVNVTVIMGENTTASLRLSRVPHIHLDFPLYTLNRDGNGTMVKRREKQASKNDTAFYQGMATNAVFQMTKTEAHRNKKNLFKLKGEFKHLGRSYFLKSEKRKKTNLKSTSASTTTTTPSRSTSASSSSPLPELDDEVYSLEAQKVQSSSTDDFMEPPPEEMIPQRRPTVSIAPKIPDVVPGNQEIKYDILNHFRFKEDQKIHPLPKASLERLDSNGSSNQPAFFAELIRRRRSTSTYAVDVAAVVDYSVYRKFFTATGNDKTAALQNIREYFAFIFNGVDQRYQSINTYFKIHVYLSQVFVVESSNASPLADTYHPNNYINAEAALEAFSNFVVRRANDVVNLFDHAMLFTAYDLASRIDSSTVGIAYISTLCKTNGLSASVIEEMNDYQSISTATHELGHSLSAKHDGEGNLCQFTDQYIMASSNSKVTSWTLYHPWQFSLCSVSSFTSYVQQLMSTSRGQTCLTGHPPMDNFQDVSGRLLGQEIPPDQQCRAIYGPKSILCRGLLTNGPEICQLMFCLDAPTDSCYAYEALDGTTCGNAKVCQSGHCVSHPQAPTADDNCLFGDEQGVVSDGMNCSQIVQAFPGVCYDATNLRLCCKSCQAAYRTVKDCEYGDRFTGCKTSLCNSGFIGYYSTGCCETCHIGVPFTTRSTHPGVIVTYAPRPVHSAVSPTDNLCGNKAWGCYFQSYAAMTECYNDSFSRNCCQFCQQHRTYIKDCEYGDHRPELCAAKDICLTNATLCCYTCKKSSTNIIVYSGLLTILPTIVLTLQSV